MTLSAALPIGGNSTEDEAGNLIDLARYPIDRLDSAAAQAFVTDCKKAFNETGVCLVKGFLTAQAVEAMRDEAAEVAPQAYYCRKAHTVYLSTADESQAPGDPRRHLEETYVGSVACDLLPPAGPLVSLYRWPPLLDFLAGVIGLPRLYHFADPLGAVSINVLQEDGCHGWHFDEAAFSITLMLQNAESGGLYEYHPGLRRDGDQKTDDLARLLAGDDEGVIRMDFQPGDLLIFAGRKALHRVTRTSGERLRYVPVLAFSAQEGETNSPEVRRLFWGRS